MPEHERDPRVYFAAERTFLSWIRTGLALMGFGFVVARFGLFLQELGLVTHDVELRSTGFSLWAGTALVMAGVIVNVVSAWQHLKTIQHLNAGRDVTGRPSMTGVILAVAMAAVGAGMAVYLLVMRP